MPVKRSHLVGKPRRRLGVGLPLDEIGEKFAARIAFDVGEIGARHRAPSASRATAAMVGRL